MFSNLTNKIKTVAIVTGVVVVGVLVYKHFTKKKEVESEPTPENNEECIDCDSE